ncbi:hypothetical protein BH10ACI1_BH10ACI1_27610 [soil metagenome]
MILDDRDVTNREVRAIEEFQKAIMLDPTLAIAHAGLGEALTVSAGLASGTKSEEFYIKAKIAIERALKLTA